MGQDYWSKEIPQIQGLSRRPIDGQFCVRNGLRRAGCISRVLDVGIRPRQRFRRFPVRPGRQKSVTRFRFRAVGNSGSVPSRLAPFSLLDSWTPISAKPGAQRAANRRRKRMAISNAEPSVRSSARLSCAPMMDWTDRHCRYLHRLMSRRTLLYTEMVAAAAIARGGARHLLRFDPAEHPVAVQLGGANPAELAEAAHVAAEEGYDEINLNVGCPSDRVRSGCFGAVLMKRPGLVADCVAAMIARSPVEVTVKCRIGVDGQRPEEALPDFLETVSAAGVGRFAIHARKALLQGLSPKENREIPPLDYPLVRRMKRAFPALHLSVNGGIDSLDAAEAQLAGGMDGAMIGRAAYRTPADVLLGADRRVFGEEGGRDVWQVIEDMRPYISRHLAEGGRLHDVVRHMLGLFAGRPGARGWRRALSEGAQGAGAGLEALDEAMALIVPEAGRAA